MSIYSSLYPHLTFARAIPPSQKVVTQYKEAKPEPKSVVPAEVKIEQPKVDKETANKPKPKKQPKIIEESETESEPTPVVRVKKPRAKKEAVKTEDPIKKEEAPIEVNEIAIETPKVSPKPKAKVDKKVSMDERKQIYLNKLSRKSVKRADNEMEQITTLLDSVGHDTTKLEQEAKELKKKIKLINTAKYFSEQN